MDTSIIWYGEDKVVNQVIVMPLTRSRSEADTGVCIVRVCDYMVNYGRLIFINPHQHMPGVILDQDIVSKVVFGPGIPLESHMV